MTLLRVENDANRSALQSESARDGKREVLSAEAFNRTIAVERKRTERSKQPFLLMLLEAGRSHGATRRGEYLDGMVTALLGLIRETDVIGWHKERTTIGVIFTGLVINNKNSVLSMILNRVSAALADRLTSDQFSQVSISFHFFPDAWDDDSSGRPSNPALYPDLMNSGKDRRSVTVIKRATDIFGSSLMLLAASPAILVIAAAIKATSKGPVFFRQQRVGQYGQHFTFLKFRSMQANNDDSVHKEYVAKFIANEAGCGAQSGNGKSVFKLTNDKRITRIGSFLRKTSLDELPQFWNVLIGEMSLVGPRPPIPYELAAYQTWHRRRVLEIKPGITGLWQVSGRSRVNFDEMVRLDLRYATSWSPLLDFTILMRTPLAVIRGEGAV